MREALIEIIFGRLPGLGNGYRNRAVSIADAILSVFPALAQSDAQPREPDVTKVICPNCTHQFTAISVADQARLRAQSDARPLYTAPHSPDASEAEEWPDHALDKFDVEALERQRERLNDFWECWLETARQYSVEGNKNGDRMMMRLANIFTRASNEITAAIRTRAADTSASRSDRGGA